MPLPGQDHVGQRDQAPVTTGAAGTRPGRRTTGAASEGGPLGVLHRPGLGGRLGDHEDDHHLEGGGHRPRPGRRRRARRRRRRGWRRPGCTAEGEEQDGLSTRSGCSIRLQQGPGASPALLLHRLSALTREVRVSAVSARARNAGDSTMRTTDHDEQDRRRCTRWCPVAPSSGSGPPAIVVGCGRHAVGGSCRGGSGRAARAPGAPSPRPRRRRRGPCRAGAGCRGRPAGPARRRRCRRAPGRCGRRPPGRSRRRRAGSAVRRLGA